MNKLKRVLCLILICVLTTMNLSTVSFAASVGDELTTPESGWQRIDDSDSKFVYKGDGWTIASRNLYYGGYRHNSNSNNLDETVSFKFQGTKLRIIASLYYSYSGGLYISIDGVKENFSEVDSGDFYQRIVYEKTDLDNKIHTVEIGKNSKGTYSYDLTFDAIDIDDTGSLVPYDTQDKTNSLKVVAEVGETIQLSVNDALSNNTGMKWSSSNNDVATVNEQGVVTGISSGNAVITVNNDDETYKETINILVIENGNENESKLAVDLNVGDSRRLTIDDLSDTVNATWDSSDENIATVDSKGRVTAVAQGATHIVVKDDQSNEIGRVLIRVR